MLNKLEIIFELFDVQVRRLRNGSILTLVFESQEDIETEKKLIDFRGCFVKSTISRAEKGKKKEQVINDSFEVFDIKNRHLRNGDKLRLVLKQEYRKEKEATAIQLRYDDCKIFMEKEQRELDFDQEEVGA